MTLEDLENARQRMRIKADEIKKEINEKCIFFTVSYTVKVYFGKSAAVYDYKETKTLETAQKWSQKYENDGLRCEIMKKITAAYPVKAIFSKNPDGQEAKV